MTVTWVLVAERPRTARSVENRSRRVINRCVCAFQVFYRTHGQDELRVLSTNQTSAELLLPLGEGCVVHVRATTAGGDGASSEPVRIPGITSKWCSRPFPPWNVLVVTPGHQGCSPHPFPPAVHLSRLGEGRQGAPSRVLPS